MSFWNISENQARNIDAYCKIIGTVAITVAGAWTLVTYFNAKQKEIQNAAMEAKKPFFTKRLEVYSDLLKVAYRIDDTSEAIQSSRDPKARSMLVKQQEENQREFWRMLGLINLVSDAGVSTEIQKFLDCFDDYKGEKRSRDCNFGALNLAKEIRASVSSEWQVHLPPQTIAKGKTTEKPQEPVEKRDMDHPPMVLQ
jgi:hypothetical protein